MKTLTFYFALRSPYSALASDLVYAAATSGAYDGKVDFRIQPFSILSPSFQNPTDNPAKVNYIIRDLPRLYGARNLPFQMPDPFEVDFSVPAKAALAAQQDGFGVAFLRAISLKRWSEQKNIEQTEIIVETAEQIGWSGDAARNALTDATIADAYQQAIDAADAAGVFGVPFFIISDGTTEEPFWGQDRWPMVLGALNA